MADDLTILKSSLADRANALHSYIASLRAESARSDLGFRNALDVCAAYTRAFLAQLDADWRAAVDRAERRELLKSSAESFLIRERWIDQRFARGSQRDVPRALQTVARLQFRRHALEQHEPVLTVGPPDSFETHQASLAEFLFTDIHLTGKAGEQPARTSGDGLSIFSVPYIEGTRVLWYPIVLGHEIAHVRLDGSSDANALERIVDRWLRRRDVAYSQAIDAIADEADDPGLARLMLNPQVASWVTELACDLNAVRVFGPAGLSAIAEFLAILEFQPDEGALDPLTHPPLWVRLTVLFEYLERLGWRDEHLPPYASVWKAQVTEPQPSMDAGSEYAATLVTDPNGMDQLIDHVAAWKDEYSYADVRWAAIRHVREELLDGIPGATHVPAEDAQWPPVTIADVVNAAWAARRVLDDREAGEATPDEGVLLDGARNQAEEQEDFAEKRVSLDRLASKAIDTLELSRLWGPERGIIPPNAVDRRTRLETDADREPAAGAVLSRGVFADLLQRNRSRSRRRRLVVTPVFEDSVQDAAIDLRLGADFIVFRHSATRAFDPLSSDEQDPRTMQERVRKSWGERFILHPQELVLASTLEYIVLPDDVAAQVLTRSSYGRLGLLTATAVQVQPGSRGCITLELVNQGETPIELAPGARVAQLMAWSVHEPAEVRRGKYWFPVGPEFSRVGEDPDRGSMEALTQAARQPAVPERPPVNVRFEGDSHVADAFYRLAQSLGADDMVLRPAGAPRRFGPDLGGGDLPALVAIVPLAIAVLAGTIQRWLQGHAHGVVIRQVGDDVVVRVEPNLPRGCVLIVSEDGVELQRLQSPPHNVNDIAQALRLHLK